MTHMIFRHGVEDFDRWYAVLKEDAGAQEASGMCLKFVMRDAEDPHTVYLWFEVDDPAAALAFTQTPEAAETGERAGSRGEMQTWVLEETTA